MAVDGHVAASTQNQALSALLFLYREVLERDFGWLDDVVRAKKPKRLPVVFTPEEAMAVVEELPHYAQLSVIRYAQFKIMRTTASGTPFF